MRKRDKKQAKRNRKVLRKMIKASKKYEYDPVKTGGCITHEVNRSIHRIIDIALRSAGIY